MISSTNHINHQTSKIMNLLNLFLQVICYFVVLVGLAILFAPPLRHRLARFLGRALLANDNPVTIGIHELGQVTGTLDSAPLTTRFMLVKQGAADNAYTIITSIADIPMAVCTDEPAATTDFVNFQMLNSAGKTTRMVAGAAIPAGSLVVSNGDGRIKALPNVAGVYWGVGVALTTANALGDLVEVDPIRVQYGVSFVT